MKQPTNQNATTLKLYTPVLVHLMNEWTNSSLQSYKSIDNQSMNDEDDDHDHELEEIDLYTVTHELRNHSRYTKISTPITIEQTRIASPTRSAPQSKDGVFFNMSAKPNKNPFSYEQVNSNNDPDSAFTGLPLERPPEYDAVAELCPPGYTETIHLQEDITSIIIDGLYVGSWSTFTICCCISMIFELVGFAISFLLIDSVAGKCGGLSGLGLHIILMILFPESFEHKRQKQSYPRPQPSSQANTVGLLIGSAATVLSILYYTRARKLATRQLEQDQESSI